jgi:hypothetical protein
MTFMFLNEPPVISVGYANSLSRIYTIRVGDFRVDLPDRLPGRPEFSSYAAESLTWLDGIPEEARC